MSSPPRFHHPQAQAPPAPDQQMKTMLQQILQGQATGALDVAKRLGEVKTQIDFTYTHLNNKIESLNSRIKCLENSSASTSAPKPMGQLPGKAIQNPKEYCNSIFSIESSPIPDHEADVREIEALLYGSDANPSILGLKNGSKPPTRIGLVLVTEDSEVSDGEDLQQVQAEIARLDQTARVQRARVTLTRPLTLPTLVESNSKTDSLVTDSTPTGRASTPSAKKTVVPEEKKEPFVPPPYKPKLPFPGRFKRDLMEKYKDIFDKHKREAEIRIPFIDTFSMLPAYQKFLRDAVNEKAKESQGIVVLTEECSVIDQKKAIKEELSDPGSFTPPKNVTKVKNKGDVVCIDSPSTTRIEPKSLPKLGNPGMFSIACSLSDLEIKDALCDSGASVNVMSSEMFKSLGIRSITHHPSSITFGDSHSRKPLGLLEDYPLKVGDCVVPTDFIIMEMQKANKLPLLLGTPFLNTIGANMDFKNQRVILMNVDDKVYYPLKPPPPKVYAEKVKSLERDRAESTTKGQGVKPFIHGQIIAEETSVPLHQPP